MQALLRQRVAPSKRLVTYRQSYVGNASSNLDVPFATPAPAAHFRTAEMISVFGFAQPTLLPGSLADPLALRNRTILLAASIPVIGHKQHLTMQTLATARFGLHQVEAATR